MLKIILFIVSMIFLLSLNTSLTRQVKKEKIISYSNDIVPIFKMHCYGCHSVHENWWTQKADTIPNGDFDITSYESLMQGGDNGEGVTPYDVEGSSIIKYITSKTIEFVSRYPKMPFVQRPLDSVEINTIKAWIRQGAKKDSIKGQTVLISIPDISIAESVKSKESVAVFCRLPIECYATITVKDAKNNRVILTKSGAIQTQSLEGNLGTATTTNRWLIWEITSESDSLKNSRLPPVVSVDLNIEANKEDIWGCEFGIKRGPIDGDAIQSYALPNPISLIKKQVVFNYRVDAASDVDVQIGHQNGFDEKLIFTDHKVDIPAGQRQYPWELSSNGKSVGSGDYFVRFRCRSRNKNIPVDDVCIPFKVVQ